MMVSCSSRLTSCELSNSGGQRGFLLAPTWFLELNPIALSLLPGLVGAGYMHTGHWGQCIQPPQMVSAENGRGCFPRKKQGAVH